MLNRLLTSVAVLSLIAGLALAVLWWRARHGHVDTVLHLGANSPHQTTLYTAPTGIAVRVQQTAADGSIADDTKPVPYRTVLGGCLFVPGLWVAIALRRKLLPRRPGWELPR